MSAPLRLDLKQVDPKSAWQPWSPDAGQGFDAKWAGHLFRRAAFGAGPDEVRKAVRDGFSETMRRLFNGHEQAAARQAFLDDAGDLIARADEPEGLRAWWLTAMLNGGHPLREKMVLFWHNHFATSIAKVRSSPLMFRQNQLLRTHALGRFGQLLAGISRDPAMLIWLDSNENVKSHPNENYAREVMELFTLGVGNYTEQDVREAAKAFTGWHLNGDDDGFELNTAEHDDGPKTILKQTGNFDGDDVLRILLKQPACPHFLSAKLYRFFVSEVDPPPALLDPLVEQLQQSDYDIGTLVRTILGSRLFFSEHAYHKRIKSPVEYVLGAVRAAWPGPFAPSNLVDALDSMGQSLFAPPNVKGWTGGKNWLTDAALLARHDFAEKIVNESTTPASAAPAAAVPSGVTLPPDIITTVSKNSNANESVRPATAASWYILKMKAQSSDMIVRAIGEQFFPGGLPDRVRGKLEAFIDLGSLAQQERPAATNSSAEANDLRRRAREAYDAQNYQLAKELSQKANASQEYSSVKPFERCVCEAIHAVMCLPEYQLC